MPERRRDREYTWGQEEYPVYTWTVSHTPVDTVYICPNCKKYIGLEGRFVFPRMGFDCPYCSHSLMVPEVVK